MPEVFLVLAIILEIVGGLLLVTVPPEKTTDQRV